MVKLILSIDGGGIKGIIPAMVLAEIESKINKPISQIFDLMAGTSTGGFVAAMLCKKDELGNPVYSAEDIVEMYKKHGENIFKSSLITSMISWIKGAKYTHKNIEGVLNEIFGDEVLKASTTNLLITSYDVRNNCPFMFKSWKKDRNFIKIKHALRASTAAPTYFTPLCLKINEEKRVLIDGGVFANNPSACAYAAGKSLFPKEELIVMSIGTGRKYTQLSHTHLRKYGKIHWIKPLIDIMFVSSLDAVNYELQQIIGENYIRIQSPLDKASTELDNTNLENIEILEVEAREMITQNQKLIDDFCNFILTKDNAS